MQKNPSQASSLAMPQGPAVPSQNRRSLQKNDEMSNRMMVYADSQDIRYRFSLWDVETVALALALVFGFVDIAGCVYAAMNKDNYSTGRFVVFLAHHILNFIGCVGCIVAYSMSVPQIYFMPIFITAFYVLIYALFAVFWVVVLALNVKLQYDLYCKVVDYDVILGEWFGKVFPVACRIPPFQLLSDGSNLLQEKIPSDFSAPQMPALPQPMPNPFKTLHHASMLYTARLYVSVIMVLLLYFGFWLTILYRSYEQSAKEQNDKSLRLPVAEVADGGQDPSSQYGYAPPQPVYASSNASTVGPHNQ